MENETKVEIPERISYYQTAPELFKGFIEIEKALNNSDIEESLRELIKMRASQLNGCAFCLDNHTKDAMKNGETVQRLIGLDAWKESPYYTARERAAIEWTEAVTLIGNHVPDEVYNRVKEQFTDKELVTITVAVCAINNWNRLNIAFHKPAGTYKA